LSVFVNLMYVFSLVLALYVVIDTSSKH